jgi:hypothetical protein
MDKQIILSELKVLLDNAPSFDNFSPTSKTHQEWLGKAYALIKRWDSIEAITFKLASDLLNMESIRETNINQIMITIHRAISDLELQVENTKDKVFGPGDVYDFYRSLKEIIKSAVNSIFIIDPYLDEEIFDVYLEGINPKINVRLLTKQCPNTLKHIVEKYYNQTSVRVELGKSSKIHDRIIFIDKNSCWVLGQSIKDAAKRTPTYLAPLSTNIIKPKKYYYDKIWESAEKI